METIYSKQTDYRATTVSGANYKFLPLGPLTGGKTATLSTGGGDNVEFQIPTGAHNLSKSVLSFEFHPPASGAELSNMVYMDCIPMIQQIQLVSSRGGVPLVDLMNANIYSNSVWKAATSIKDLLSFEHHGHVSVGASANYAGRMLQKNSFDRLKQIYEYTGPNLTLVADVTTNTKYLITAINGTNVGADAGGVKTLALTDSNTLEYNVPNRRYDNSVVDSELEPQYLEITRAAATNDPAVAVATPVIRVKLPLGMFYETLLGYDKTIPINEPLTLKIIWAPSPQIYYTVTSGGVAVVKDVTDGAAAATGDISISKLTLYIATEADVDTAREVMSVAESEAGMQIHVDYCVGKQQSFPTGTAFSYPSRITRMNGLRLKRIYTAAYHPTRNSITAYDHSCLGTSKVNEYYTELDLMRQQSFNVNLGENDDGMIMRAKLHESILSLSPNVHKYNWLHVDDWCGEKPIWKQIKEDQNVIAGLDLSIDHEYTFNATDVDNTVALSVYQFQVTQRLLHISRQGINFLG